MRLATYVLALTMLTVGLSVGPAAAQGELCAVDEDEAGLCLREENPVDTPDNECDRAKAPYEASTSVGGHVDAGGVDAGASAMGRQLCESLFNEESITVDANACEDWTGKCATLFYQWRRSESYAGLHPSCRMHLRVVAAGPFVNVVEGCPVGPPNPGWGGLVPWDELP